MESKQKHSNPIWLAADTFQCYLTMVSVGMVWDLAWLPTGKVRRGGDGSFMGFEFEVMDDEVRMVKEKLDTSCWPAYMGACNRIMIMLTGWTVGDNEEKYIDGLDANDIPTDIPT